MFRNEPNIDARLLSFANVIVEPHHASGTIEARKAMGRLVRDNLAAHFAGQPAADAGDLSYLGLLIAALQRRANLGGTGMSQTIT